MNRKPVRGAARLAAILDALPDALLLVDATGVIVNANAMALELFEAGGSAVLGLSITTVLPSLQGDVTPRPSAPMLPAGSSVAVDTSTTVPSGLVRERLTARRTDGSTLPVEVTSSSLPDTADELSLLVVRDLSASLDVEAELRRQQRQTELILRAASEGIIGIDADGRIVLVNPAAARILRFRAGDLGGQHLHQLLAYANADGSPVAEEDCPPFDTLRTGRKHRLRDQVLWRKDNTPVTVDMSTAPVAEGDTLVGAVMTFTDTSEIRAVSRRNEELVAVLEAELRRPLSVVHRELDGLSGTSVGELGPAARRVLSHVAGELDRFSQLLGDVLDYHHFATRAEPLERRQDDLESLVLAAVEEVQDTAAAGGLDMTVHVEPGQVWVEHERMVLALRHLLLDTVSASPTGSTVVVAAAPRGEHARIEIRGTLTGSSTLHLPIARGIIERHDGTVTTHRITGKGHTYVIELPLDAPTGGQHAAGQSPPALPVAKSNGHGTRHGAQSRKTLTTPTAQIPRQATSVEARRPPDLASPELATETVQDLPGGLTTVSREAPQQAGQDSVDTEYPGDHSDEPAPADSPPPPGVAMRKAMAAPEAEPRGRRRGASSERPSGHRGHAAPPPASAESVADADPGQTARAGHRGVGQRATDDDTSDRDTATTRVESAQDDNDSPEGDDVLVRPGAGRRRQSSESGDAGAAQLLMWPNPDPGTVELLRQRGYDSVALPSPKAAAEYGLTRQTGNADAAQRPLALFVDPIAAPITRKGLRTLRSAAEDAHVPVLVTAGFRRAAGDQGAPPAALLQALSPADGDISRVLLIEPDLGMASALTVSLEQSGMEVLHAASESDGVTAASEGETDLVVMDLMLVRRRRLGIIDWLRTHDRLSTTPVLAYTTDNASGRSDTDAQLWLSERASDGETQQRIVDLLNKVASPPVSGRS